MKTKEQELTLLGLQEINESERNEIVGGIVQGDYIICCIDIPPMNEKFKWPWEMILL